MKNLDEAIVLKLNRQDKEFIRKMANEQRLSVFSIYP